MHTVPLVVAATGSTNTKNVTCDFLDSEYFCGYTVGDCWHPTAVSYTENSGNAQLLKFDVFNNSRPSAVIKIMQCDKFDFVRDNSYVG